MGRGEGGREISTFQTFAKLHLLGEKNLFSYMTLPQWNVGFHGNPFTVFWFRRWRAFLASTVERKRCVQLQLIPPPPFKCGKVQRIILKYCWWFGSELPSYLIIHIWKMHKGTQQTVSQLFLVLADLLFIIYNYNLLLLYSKNQLVLHSDFF